MYRQYARDFLKIISPSVRDAMKHPGTDLHIISSTILRFLCTEVLDLWFYCPSSETKFLKELEESLSKLRSHQGKQLQYSLPLQLFELKLKISLFNTSASDLSLSCLKTC